jgi:IS5 family transposase
MVQTLQAASHDRSACGPVAGGHTDGMNSRVHPTYKTKYRVANWAEYERGLIQRGDITLWLSPEAVSKWKPRGLGKRGGQRKYSDLAIETALTLRLVFHLPLRQTEGFITSVFVMMGINLEVPDHTTLSRRSQHLGAQLRRVLTGKPMHLIVDSTGLSIVGEGEWAAAKHGGKGKRGWKKLHLGVDRAGIIVAQVLTPGNADDAAQVPELLHAIEGDIVSITADAAYDTIAVYDAAKARGAKAIVPPTKTAVASGRKPRSTARDRTIRRVKKVGVREWKKESRYHQQGRVENAFFRYKTILGGSLRARNDDGQQTEDVIACNILNRMTELGRPESYAVGA